MAVYSGFFCANLPACAMSVYTWDQVKDKFEAANPALKADAIGVSELRAQEITAYLRPNPTLGVTADGTQIAPNKGVWQPLSGTSVAPTLSYLHEREHKRELRLESAQEGTRIASSQHDDLERTLLFTLRMAFVQTLEAKAIVDLSHDQLDYYDRIIDISRARFNSGDLAQLDLDRIELQRVQYESDLQTAEVNLR
jgi:cobalt-zinc-cadmium efflux system outer membrane protein